MHKINKNEERKYEKQKNGIIIPTPITGFSPSIKDSDQQDMNYWHTEILTEAESPHRTLIVIQILGVKVGYIPGLHNLWVFICEY